MALIQDGYILLARKIRKSDIWQNKPSWWLKVWCYILMQTNHADNKYFKRGQNFFTREQIYRDCKLYLDGIKSDTIDNVIRWLRTPIHKTENLSLKTEPEPSQIPYTTTQITTQKTTRGIIITVCNYDFYQNPINYKNDTENDTPDETKTRQKRDRNDTVNNNVKELKNYKKELYIQHFEEIWSKYPRRIGRKDALRHFIASVVTDNDWQDIQLALNNYCNSQIVKEGNANYIQHGSKWFNNWRDWINYSEIAPAKDMGKEKILKSLRGEDNNE